MKLFKRSKFWSVQFKTRHGTKKICTWETDKAKAEEVVAKAGIMEIESSRHAAMLANVASMYAITGRRVSPLESYREWVAHLEAATGSPATVSIYKLRVFQFLTKLNWPALCEVSTADVDKFVNTTERELHAQTRNVIRCALSHFFRFAENEGWCRNPVANAKVKRHLLTHAQKESAHWRPFSDDEFQRIISAAGDDPFWAPALMIARYTGLRWGDVESLEWDSVHADHLVVWTDKRDKRCEIPLADELKPVFEQLSANRNGSPLVLPRIYPSEKRTAWDNLRIKAGLKESGLVLHSLRHSYAQGLFSAGIPLDEIRKRLGHFSQSTTLGYIASLHK